ncbi:MAG: RluA family pseudouridine synthase, partial [Candidatus Aminicenantes bacterium]|nr:RluA family pseudouridine synthase [Candidatus Aminicenantes bacterium]
MPKQEFCVTQPEHEEQRADVFLADRLPDLSRSQIHKFIVQDRVKVNGAMIKPSYRLQDGDTITI